MEVKMEMLCFRLPGHGDSTLKHMDALRSRQHFCDVTIVAGNKQAFRGHKVVLAACSPFLRDQFLLSPSSKLQVSMLHSSAVVCDLLQSCYTGMLQFNPEEIVNYLTAASYLQMEHIVERCRGALKKYIQPRNPSPPRIKSEEGQSTPVIMGGSALSFASMSPPAGQSSTVQPHSPAARGPDEAVERTQAGGRHRADAPLLHQASIKVNPSDEEDEAAKDYDVFTVFIPEEEEEEGGAGSTRGRGGEEEEEDVGGPPAGLSAGPQGAGYPETDGVMEGDGEAGGNAGEPDLGLLAREGLTMEGLRALRRRLAEPKASRGGRGRARGRGFKKRKWASSPGAAEHPDLWYMASTGMGGGFGLDYSQEGLKVGNYLSVDLPQMDFGMGGEGDEGGPMGGGMAQYAMGGESTGEGGSGLGGVPAEEGPGGDESVAVVGSTSSVAGPVICDHCGMTFPSAHSLAVHARSTHLLYSCPCCGKHFHHSANLTRHMAVHRGAGKTHQCPLCYKTFTQKSTLIDHMNLHSGERPHRCAYCNARFAHKPALRRHLKEQHGKTTGQNSLHEQQEREREQGGGAVREEELEHPVTGQGS